MKTGKVLLQGSFPQLDYAPLVSPQNKDVCGDRYTPNVECSYQVQGPENAYVYVEFLSLDLDKDCSQDNLAVFGKQKKKTICGSTRGKSTKQQTTFVVEDNTALVTFQSNFDYACQGFSGFMTVFIPSTKTRKRK